jgi:hypothetical protein
MQNRLAQRSDNSFKRYSDSHPSQQLVTTHGDCHVIPLSKKVTRYYHVLVTIRGVWIDNWIYWTLITRNYK